MVAEIATREEVHDEVQILLVLEGVAHIDQEGVFELREELALVHDGVDTSFLDDPGFGHLLHGV